MHLISVNVGKARAIAKAKSVGKTGIFKEPAAGPARITALGLEGDAICDVEHHGGYDQAVYVFGAADYDWWSAALGKSLAPGTFGENLTISGLESADYACGDILRVGEVVLQITAPRIPCITLSRRMEDPDFITRFREAERPGFYCRVLQEGSVQAGDPVTVERFMGETVTLLEMFHNFTLKQPGLDYLRRYLLAPTPSRGRKRMEAKYRVLFNIDADPAEQDLQFLEDRIIEFNYAATGYTDGERFAILLRDGENQIYAGISGFTWGRSGRVEWLWVREDWRGKGLGRDLLARAEEEVIRRGCEVMVLDTHSFQAPDFYARLGYQVAGVTPDFPKNHHSIAMYKRLAIKGAGADE